MKKIENEVARKLCTKENLPVAKEVTERLLRVAMAGQDSKSVRQYAALVDDIEKAIEENEKQATTHADGGLPGIGIITEPLDTANKKTSARKVG